MQVENVDGTKKMIERFDSRKLLSHLKNPKVKEVHVFRLAPGMIVEIKGKPYEVVSVNSKGKKAILYLAKI